MWYILEDTVPAEENYAWASGVVSEHSCIYPCDIEIPFHLNLHLLHPVFICLKRGKSILDKGGIGFGPPLGFWSIFGVWSLVNHTEFCSCTRCSQSLLPHEGLTKHYLFRWTVGTTLSSEVTYAGGPL